LTELDYKKRAMRLSRGLGDQVPSFDPSQSVSIVPFRTTQNGLISIETRLDGDRRINAILDSGASSSVISSAAVERLNLRHRIIKGQTVQVIGAAGMANNVEIIFLPSARVADLQQNNIRALILDFNAINETSGFEQSGILGGDFLRHFRVVIDFYRSQVAFEPQTSAITRIQANPPSNDQGRNAPDSR
jgi:predicted aspartyl protease